MERKYLVELDIDPPSTFVFSGVKETEASIIAFPKTRRIESLLLDSFKRANENPLSNGGKWATRHSYSNAGQIVGEAYSGGTSSQGAAYWTPQEFEEPGVAVELHVLPVGEQFRLYNCLQSPTTNGNGYQLLFVSESSSVGSFVLEGIVGGTLVFETKAITTTVEAGDWIGISVQDGKVLAWHKAIAGSWEIVAEHSDSNYTKGYVGLEADSGPTRVRNFEVGES